MVAATSRAGARARRGRRGGAHRRRIVAHGDRRDPVSRPGTTGADRRGRRARRPGGPTATTRPRSSATSRSATSPSTPRSCSMTSRPAPSESRTSRRSGPSASASRCAIPLAGSSSSSTAGSCASDAREVDDAAGAGRELVAEPVGVVAESEQLDQLVDTRVHRGFGARDRGEVQRRPRPGCGPAPTRSHATAMVSRTVSAGKRRPSWNDRPSPSARVGGRAGARQLDHGHRRRPQHDRCPRRDARTRRRRRTAWSCPRRSGPTTPTISPASEGQRDVVERDDATEPAP